MDVLLEDMDESVTEVLKTLKWFQKQSGFTVNYDKTTLYRIGSLNQAKAGSYVMVDGMNKIKETDDPINILGVWID